MNDIDDSIDDNIRSALRDADRKDKLDIVSVVVGIPVIELKKIMESTGSLDIMHRTMLGIHLLT